MRSLMLLLALIFCPAVVHAAIKGEVVEYKDGDTVLEGYLAYDDAIEGKRPGILVVHDWMGFGDYGNRRARQLAELGYAAFAVDIYGKGVRPQNTDEAGAEAGKYKGDLPLLRQRAHAGLEAFKQYDVVDASRLAAIGYCFGGTTVLEMARASEPLAGVVSFHGGLKTSLPAKGDQVKAKVLALHGAVDPYVPAEEVANFQKEMTDAHADWQMVYYSDAVHSFTKKEAGDDVKSGAAYNAAADRRSWEAMKAFFEELFGHRAK